MNSEKIGEILNLIVQYFYRINIPIFGKPLLEWIKLTFLYSFVIWLSIIGWNLYQTLQEYKTLQQQEDNIKGILQQKERIVKNYKDKIKEINIAYKEVSLYFTEKQVKKLLTKVNKEVLKISKLLNQKEIKDAVNFYRIKAFNYRLSLKNLVKPPEVYALKDFRFESTIFKYFQSSLTTYYNKLRTNKKRSISVKVKVTKLDDKIVLYLVPSQVSILKFKPVLWSGLVENPEKAYVYPTLTYFDKESLMDGKKLSPLFFGWYLKLNTK